MKIALDYGHCLTGYDTGARSQGYKEEVLTREIGFKVKAKLEKLGHEIIVISPNYANSLNESLTNRVVAANKQSVDLSVSIHINAGGGEGAEIYTKGGIVFTEAYNILTNLSKLGYKARGIKNGNDFALVGSINCNKAMLVEACFIDSLRDMTIYDGEKIASAIVNGIDNRTVNVETNQEIKIGTPIIGAEKISKEYKESGSFTCNDKIYFRNNVGIDNKNKIEGYYSNDESLKYDYVVITDKYVYISWISASAKVRRYIPIREITTGKYGPVWGTIK